MPSNSRRRFSNANGQWGQFIPRRSGRGPKKVHQEKGSNKKRKRGDRGGVADIECDTSNGSNSLVHQQYNDDLLQGSSPPAPTGGGSNILSTSDYTYYLPILWKVCFIQDHHSSLQNNIFLNRG